MRTCSEIVFRLRQEAGNLCLFAAKPRLADFSAPPSPLPGLPDPGPVVEKLRNTGFRAEVERLAEDALRHRFTLLSATEVDAGTRIRWRRDYAANVESGTPYFRLVPYLDPARAGDHKPIWELNRHQHLVLLAQAFRFTGRAEFLDGIQTQAESWMEDNPWMRGINWASALEVAFRALSWVWVYHLAGAEMKPAFRARFLEELYRHARYLERNLSVYFSPNTHLLGEAVALHAIGTLFPGFPGAHRWKRLGGEMVRNQMFAQVREDGSHFEQSTYYHVYALDFFLLHALLAETPPAYRERLARMAEYLNALLGRSGSLPFFGDDDGGRVFHPYGRRDRFGRATVATCGVLMGRPEWIGEPAALFEQAAWWLGVKALDAAIPSPSVPPASRLFTDAGMAVMCGGDLQMVVDVGAFGPWSAGHSHSDTLHLTASTCTGELLVDPATYTYVGDALWRNRFRGSAAHNTVRIDGRDQAVPAGPFAWRDKPGVEVLLWRTCERHDYLDAVCRVGELSHRRRILFIKPRLVLILDEIEGPPGEHLVEQFWHCGQPARRHSPAVVQIGSGCSLVLAQPCDVELSEGGLYGWRSLAFAHKEPAPVVRAVRGGPAPLRMVAMLELGQDEPRGLSLEENAADIRLKFGDGAATYTVRGMPEYTVK